MVLVEPGRSAHLMGMAGHDPVVFFTYRDDLPQARGTTPTTRPAAALRAVYGDFDGLMPEILDLVERSGTTHADTVGQIHLEHWSRGRVVLLGRLRLVPHALLGPRVRARPRRRREPRTPPPGARRHRPGRPRRARRVGGRAAARHRRGAVRRPPGPALLPARATAWSPPCARRRCRSSRSPGWRRCSGPPGGVPRVPNAPEFRPGTTFTGRSPPRPGLRSRSLRKLSLDRAWRAPTTLGHLIAAGRYRASSTARRSVASRARVGSSSRRPAAPVDRAAAPKGRVPPLMRPDHEIPQPSAIPAVPDRRPLRDRAGGRRRARPLAVPGPARVAR